jgi:glycosyltransferase involved in cell wall biosynthesis
MQTYRAFPTDAFPAPPAMPRSNAAEVSQPSVVTLLSSVHVAISYELGGSGRVFAELCRYLPAAGVRFAGAVAEPDNVHAVSEGRVKLFASSTSSMKNRLQNGRRTLLQLIEAEKADIVASHFALYAAPLLDKLYRRRNFAFVNHFHGPWAAESVQEGANASVALAKKTLEGLVYRRAKRTIVLSRAFARIAAEDYRIPEDSICVVPGSVDTNRFNTDLTRHQARAALGLPSDRLLLVAVRRLANRMGLHQLVEAMREVSRAVPDVLLLIAGDGSLREKLNAAIAEFALQDHVRLLGFVADERLPLLYRAADLNVVPSQGLEGFGLVAVEALATGTPSLVTPVGGLPEIISVLNPSLVLSSTASAAMASRLVEILKGNHKLPTETQCRDFVLGNYTSELMAQRTARVYREVA